MMQDFLHSRYGHDPQRHLEHLACKILLAILCLHVVRLQSNKMPSYIQTEIKQMGNSTNLAGKIEHAQFTMQDCSRLPCKIAC